LIILRSNLMNVKFMKSTEKHQLKPPFSCHSNGNNLFQ
jgi:hypothetical protein